MSGQSSVTESSYIAVGIEGTGTFSLNGGTLTTPTVAGGTGKGTFNFNGGTLRAAMDSSYFVQGLTTANVQKGGVVIDTNGYRVTVMQALLHDTADGAPKLDGGLTKNGAGTLVLNGANTYTGATNVAAGTLTVNGSIIGAAASGGTGQTTLFTGATLAGNGTIGGNVVTNGGNLDPGDVGVGRLTVNGHVIFGTGTSLDLELGGLTAGSEYDQLVAGILGINGGDLHVSIVNGFKLTVGQKFFVIDTNGGAFPPGEFDNAPAGIYTDAAGDRFTVTYLDRDPASGDGVNNDVSLTVLAVPEPKTWALLIVGVIALVRALACRRKFN